MSSHVQVWRCGVLGWAAVLLLGGLSAAGEGGAKPVKIGRYNPDARVVDLFAAIEDGQIAVRLAPQGAFACRTAIQNKTDEPLNVKLPDSFVGVPILAQFGSDPGGSTQTLGGGMGGYGMRGATGVLSLSPKKAAQFSVSMVCLEYEKPGPDPGARTRSSPSRVSRRRPASLRCARCWATARSAKTRPRPRPGT